MKEIERKFLIKQMPDLSVLTPVRYERYFVSDVADTQVRVQKKGDVFEMETKTKISDIEYKKEKRKITESEFIELSKKCDKKIIRDSYLINDSPSITIKEYFGDYEGLFRAEIEYSSLEQAKSFALPYWFGTEITDTDLGSDNKLIKLNREDFLKILEVIK